MSVLEMEKSKFKYNEYVTIYEVMCNLQSMKIAHKVVVYNFTFLRVLRITILIGLTSVKTQNAG